VSIFGNKLTLTNTKVETRPCNSFLLVNISSMCQLLHFFSIYHNIIIYGIVKLVKGWLYLK